MWNWVSKEMDDEGGVHAIVNNFKMQQNRRVRVGICDLDAVAFLICFGRHVKRS